MNEEQYRLPDFVYRWFDSGVEAQEPANPKYPNGVVVVAGNNPEPACSFVLPYPAPRVGQWEVECFKCGKRVRLTAAGRADDPRVIRVGCKEVNLNG